MYSAIWYECVYLSFNLKAQYPYIYIYSTARRERSRRQFNPQTGFIVLSLFRPPVAVIDLSSASIFLSREKILQRHVLEDLQSFLYFFFFRCLPLSFFFLPFTFRKWHLSWVSLLFDLSRFLRFFPLVDQSRKVSPSIQRVSRNPRL